MSIQRISPDQIPNPFFRRVVEESALPQVGSRGEAIKALQELLIQAGAAPAGNASGVFDQRTVAALKQFQKQRELPVTGKLDTQTLNALSESDNTTFVHYQFTETQFTNGYRSFSPEPVDLHFQSEQPISTLSSIAIHWKEGDRSPEIRRVQDLLVTIGFMDKQAVTGQYDHNTLAAILRFQLLQSQQTNAPVTGYCDAQTLKALDEQSRPGLSLPNPTDSPSFPRDLSINRQPVKLIVDRERHIAYRLTPDGGVQEIPVRVGRGTGNSMKGQRSPQATQPGIMRIGQTFTGEDVARLGQQSRWRDRSVYGNLLFDLHRYDPRSRSQTPTDQELHATPDKGSLGGDRSHGCIGFSEDDADSLRETLKAGDLIIVI